MEDNKKDIKFITAKEARTKTEESTFLLRLAYKLIQEAANRNENTVELDVINKDPLIIEQVKASLTSNGYEWHWYVWSDPEGVEMDEVDHHVLVINW